MTLEWRHLSGKRDNDLVAGFCWQGVREGIVASEHSESLKKDMNGRMEGGSGYRKIQEVLKIRSDHCTCYFLFCFIYL